MVIFNEQELNRGNIKNNTCDIVHEERACQREIDLYSNILLY